MEAIIMKGKSIITVLVFVVVLVGLYWVFIPKKDTPEEPTNKTPEISQLEFTFEKPKWLEGHPKQKNIEEYVRKRKNKLTEEAVELKEEFPESNLLPYQLHITIERTVVDAYESVLITDYYYTGGAHGNTQYHYYNLLNGKDISLTEYLSHKQSTEEDLLKRVNARLQNDKHQTIDSFNDVPWQVHHPENEEQIGIRILFPPYAVAAYAVGTISYTL